MGWSKRDLVKKAYGALGLAAYDFDLSPDQLQDGLSSLDAMMALWDAQGIRLGYPCSATPTSGDLNQDSGLPDFAVQAVFLNLALELAPSVGREVSPRIAAKADRGHSTLLALAAAPISMQVRPGTPAGAGHKPWRGTIRRFLDACDDDIAINEDSELEVK